jgi:hypothetical protein
MPTRAERRDIREGFQNEAELALVRAQYATLQDACAEYFQVYGIEDDDLGKKLVAALGRSVPIRATSCGDVTNATTTVASGSVLSDCPVPESLEAIKTQASSTSADGGGISGMST